MTDQQFDEIVAKVTAVANDVYRVLGSEHLDEAAYDRAMRIGLQGVIEYVSQPILSVMYRGFSVSELRPDFFLIFRNEAEQTVERVVLELKTLSGLQEGAYRQVRTYLNHGRIQRGILINFSFAQDDTLHVETFRAW